MDRNIVIHEAVLPFTDHVTPFFRSYPDYLLKVPVKADAFREFSVVKICNSYDLALKKDGKDTEHRGIGLGNVRQTLQRCGGGMDIEEKDREFAVSITIPCPEGDAAETR